MRRNPVIAVCAFVLGMAATIAWPLPSFAADTAIPQLKAIVVTPLDRKLGTIVATLPDPVGDATLAVSDTDARNRIGAAEKDDVVTIGVDDPANPHTITKLVSIARPVSIYWRLLALGISAAILLLFASIATHWRPWRFMIGVDNRYSNSQSQLALWFGVAATVYLATVGLRMVLLGMDFIGGVGLTANVIALTGLSALSFGGAKMITAQKVADAEEKGIIAPKAKAAKANLLRDLFTNDAGKVDLGDFQMILISLLASVLFLISCVHFLGMLALEPIITLPDVDSSLLAGFGVGQGAYLVKKAALKVGEG